MTFASSIQRDVTVEDIEAVLATVNKLSPSGKTQVDILMRSLVMGCKILGIPRDNLFAVIEKAWGDPYKFYQLPRAH